MEEETKAVGDVDPVAIGDLVFLEGWLLSCPHPTPTLSPTPKPNPTPNPTPTPTPTPNSPYTAALLAEHARRRTERPTATPHVSRAHLAVPRT